jgi:DNA-binding transcriptional LysR family regulator
MSNSDPKRRAAAPSGAAWAPLRAVQAFAAVVQAGSVVAAGRELGVTASAVSHLLRQLEQRLGARLFTRDGRGLTTTSEGDRLAAAVGPALRTIDASLRSFSRRSSELRISTLSTFAVRWLIPRLSAFQELHPEIELYLSTSTRPVDLSAERFDCAIRLGDGAWVDVVAEELYREELVPACSPQWLTARHLASPQQLARATLLHSQARRGDWAAWLAAAGVRGVDTRKGPVFETRALTIQAAIARMGIAVIDPRFIEAELAVRQLVVPFAPRVGLREGYWLVWQRGTESARPLSAFRRWLVAEFAKPGRDG